MRFLSLALSTFALFAPSLATTVDVPFGATFLGTPDDTSNPQGFVEGGKTVIDDSNFVYDLPSIGSVVSVMWRFASSVIPSTVYVRTYLQKPDEHWRFKMINEYRIDTPPGLSTFGKRAFWTNAIDIPYGSLSIDNGEFVGFYFPNPVDIVNVYINTTVPDYNKVEWVMPGNFTDTVNWSPEPKFYFPTGYTTGTDLNSQRRLDDGQYTGGSNPDMNLVSWYYIPSWYQYVQTNPSLYPITVNQDFSLSNEDQPDPSKWNEGFISRGNHKDAFKFVVRVVQRDGSTHGDPQFAGFQGQNFQFHGMADEVFNLISTPKFQLNGNFKYLSSGKCDYNETECYTHPGTYVDQLGFTIGDIQIKAIAGSHDKGLRIWMNDIEFHPDANTKAIFSIFNSTEQTGFLKHPSKGKFIVDTPHFTVQATNSDYFFNMEVALKHTAALLAGQKKVSLKQKFLCMSDGQNVATRLSKIEDFMSNYYPRFPIHGLIGQTWRNVDICGHEWIGDASDYVTSDLFATDSVFNYYGKHL